MSWVEEIAEEAAKEVFRFAVKELTEYAMRLVQGEESMYHAGQSLMRMHRVYWDTMARMREKVQQQQKGQPGSTR